MKPYSLALRSSVLGTQAEIKDLSDIAMGWRRTIGLNEGFLFGSFTLYPGEIDLEQAFDTWLGYDLQERVGSVTWEGMIYEMVLSRAGSKRRRSLGELWNAVSARYRTTAWIGDNLVLNPGFETLSGGADVFTEWAENPDVGTIADGGATNHAGAHSLKMTSGGTVDPDGSSDTWVRQNIIVASGTAYHMSFWTRGNAGVAGRYGVRDPNAAEWLITPRDTGVPGNVFTQVTCEFTGTGEGEVLIYFWAGLTTGNIAYFDDVAVGTAGEGTFDTAFLNPLENSAGKYGRREEMLLMDKTPQATAQAALAAFLAQHGWPYGRGVSLTSRDDSSLQVTVAGYINTANWLFQMAGFGGAANISAWLADIVGADFGLSLSHDGTVTTAGDCEFLKAGMITTNALQAETSLPFPTRAWDVIKSLLDMGIEYPAASGLYRPTRAWVDVGRLLHYAPLDTSPRYYWKDGKLYHRSGAPVVNPYAVRPGVVRDVNYPGQRVDPGALLQDPRDMLIVEVEADGDGGLTMKPEDYDEVEGIYARIGAQNVLDDIEEASRDSTG